MAGRAEGGGGGGRRRRERRSTRLASLFADRCKTAPFGAVSSVDGLTGERLKLRPVVRPSRALRCRPVSSKLGFGSAGPDQRLKSGAVTGSVTGAVTGSRS